jgi:predicted enzyme related to lactoylglutathione lyase
MDGLLPGAVVFAKDVDKVAGFYRDLLSLSEKARDTGKVVLESKTYSLVIHGIPDHISQSINISTPPVLRENSAMKLYFPVSSIADARDMASKLGGALKPKDNEWHISNFVACDGYDPEGNVFQVRQLLP